MEGVWTKVNIADHLMSHPFLVMQRAEKYVAILHILMLQLSPKMTQQEWYPLIKSNDNPPPAYIIWYKVNVKIEETVNIIQVAPKLEIWNCVCWGVEMGSYWIYGLFIAKSFLFAWIYSQFSASFTTVIPNHMCVTFFSFWKLIESSIYH